MNHARPIDEVIRDEKTPPRLKKLLGEIPTIREFGKANGLKPTANYKNYVKLDRPVAVYVVSACEPLQFKSREWRFPIIGSVPYLGWFDVDGAKKFARQLKDSDPRLDVDIRGARAYSTLGWFPDPVLSTMIPEGDEAMGELVNVVIHESVHATVYISGQSYFNESLASFVADRLTYAYLDQKYGPQSAERKAYFDGDQEGERRGKILHAAYESLARLYASSKPDEEKLREKAEIFAGLKKDLKAQRDLNNASLIQYQAYNVGEAEFTRLYESCGKDWSRFLRVLMKLQIGSFKREHQEDLKDVLLPLADAGCS